MNNRVTELFGIKYPIIQAGMIWCSGWRLASAVSNAGGLGLIGSGSMTPGILLEHIHKCKAATSNPFGVNIPLIYPYTGEMIDICIEQSIKIIFTSAGSPATWTTVLKEKGITVVHVVSNVKFARKSEECGVDAIVAEGFEAGGHNGADELTTFTLIPMVRQAVSIPLIAAGGIATGGAMMAALALGADGVQIGTRFVASDESSANINFKQRIIEASDNDTFLVMKKHVPVRIFKNSFFRVIREAEQNNASKEELIQLLGRGKARLGMFEGDTVNGELEIGQISGLIHEIRPAGEIIRDILSEFNHLKKELLQQNF